MESRRLNFLVMTACSLAVFLFVIFDFAPTPASAIGVLNPIGGKFLPGVTDIYTPIPLCGLEVTIKGTDQLIHPFIFQPVKVYNKFYQTTYHVGTNVLGMYTLINPNPFCGGIPILYMFGSGANF